MDIILDVSAFQSVGQLDSLLRHSSDRIVGVYIKATQGLHYTNDLADAFAAVCCAHGTPFGYYDFLTNDQMVDQAKAFKDFVASLKHNQPSLMPTCDAEGAYNKFAAGVTNWESDYGGPCVTYASLAMMDKYAQMANPKWVAQYDRNGYYRPTEDEIENYRKQGYALWQFTDSYLGLNQDASVVLDFNALVKKGQ